MLRAAQAEYEATGSQRIMFRRGGGADEADDEVGPGPCVQRVE